MAEVTSPSLQDVMSGIANLGAQLNAVTLAVHELKDALTGVANETLSCKSSISEIREQVFNEGFITKAVERSELSADFRESVEAAKTEIANSVTALQESSERRHSILVNNQERLPGRTRDLLVSTVVSEAGSRVFFKVGDSMEFLTGGAYDDGKPFTGSCSVGPYSSVSAIKTNAVNFVTTPDPTAGRIFQGVKMTGSGNVMVDGALSKKQGAVLTLRTTPQARLTLVVEYQATQAKEQTGGILIVPAGSNETVAYMEPFGATKFQRTYEYTVPRGCSSIDLCFVRSGANGSVVISSVSELATGTYKDFMCEITKMPERFASYEASIAAIKATVANYGSDLVDFSGKFSNFKEQMQKAANEAAKDTTRVTMWADRINSVLEEVAGVVDAADEFHQDFQDLRALVSRYLDWKVKIASSEKQEMDAHAALMQSELELMGFKKAALVGQTLDGGAHAVEATSQVVRDVGAARERGRARESWK